MRKKDAIKFVIVRSIGNFLLLFSLYGVLATFGPALYYEAKFQVIKFRGVDFKVVRADEVPKQQGFGDVGRVSDSNSSGPGFGQILQGSKEQILIPADTQFSISVPKIGASAKIYPNVDPSNPQEFLPVLQKGIAHAKGSVFPGFAGNVYLFAHSADNWWSAGRYNAVFYLLKNLTGGDLITVFFENVRYDYIVETILIMDPKDTTYIGKSQTGEKRLVLQTCWPPGTTWKRIVVIAKPK